MQADGTVIATYSRRMGVELDDGRTIDARIKGKRLRVVCGDRVVLEQIAGEADWLILDVQDRRNALTRPNLRGESEILAANVDQLIVTASPLPSPDWFVVDRYLAAAEAMPARAAVLFNKSDLDAGKHDDDLAVFAAIGYPVLRSSCETGEGLDELTALLQGRLSIFVGQSGVGKSSVINRLVDGDLQKVAGISKKHEEGRHTTVNSRLIHLPGGGSVVDSPGVRDFAPFVDDPTDADVGFREILEASAQCRFSNCRHIREPGCAVKAAADTGKISERRLESYRRLLRLSERVLDKRRPGR